MNYFELQGQEKKPGLYAANYRDSEWRVKQVKDGKINNETKRLVAISDGSHQDAQRAAEVCALGIVKAPFAGGVADLKADGFDLHYSPMKKSIGGLINYRDAIAPMRMRELNESALLLAKTMFDARTVERVGWVAELGGSGVLTQAMRILADQGTKLKGHKIYLARPSTSVMDALKQAQRLELTIERRFHETGALDAIGNRDQLEVMGHRWRTQGAHYTTVNLIVDASTFATKLVALAAGAGTLIGMAKLGNEAAKVIAPSKHAKWMGRL